MPVNARFCLDCTASVQADLVGDPGLLKRLLSIHESPAWRCEKRRRPYRARRDCRTDNRRLEFGPQRLEERRLLAVSAELNGAGNVAIFADDTGDIADEVELSILGGTSLRVNSPEGVSAGNGFTQVDANTATIPLVDITGGGIQVDTFAGDDVLIVHSTAVGITTTLQSGSGNDEIRIGSSAAWIDEILGEIFVDGGDHAAGTASLTVRGEVNTLASGDRLVVSDAGALADHTYLLTADRFQRTTPGAAAAPIHYAAIETLDLTTTAGAAEVTLQDTAAAVNTNLVTQDAADQVTVVRSGDDSNLRIDSGAGDDTLHVLSTGGAAAAGHPLLGSFLVATSGAGQDLLALDGTGAASRLHWDAGAEADAAHVRATAADSLTELVGGSGNDTISIGSGVQSLDGIAGAIFVVGGQHDAGGRTISSGGAVLPNMPYGPASRFEPDPPAAADVGDTLNLLDGLDGDGKAYVLNPHDLIRSGRVIVHYDDVETVNLQAGVGADRLTVFLPQTPTVITFDGGDQQNGADQLQVVGNQLPNTTRIGNTTSDPAVRAPLEISNVEFIAAFGGSDQGNDDDVLINDTSTPAWMDGMGGDDLLVGGSATDVLIGGAGIDALFGNTGSDFVIADVRVLAVDILPGGTASARIDVVPTGGDLVLGNLGEGNDFGFFDEGLALVPPGASPDFADEIENLFEEGAQKGVWSWLLARFPVPSEPAAQALVERAVEALLNVTGTDSLDLVMPAHTGFMSSPDPPSLLDPLDVNGDGSVSPLDALLVLNELNDPFGGRARAAEVARNIDRVFLDVNRDGFVSPIDALHILNRLNTSVASPQRLLLAATADIAAAMQTERRPKGLRRLP
jgi:Ca2+-binding RTX toxin-like protein